MDLNPGLDGLPLHILEAEQEKAADKIQDYYDDIEYAKRNKTKREVKRLEGIQQLWFIYYNQISGKIDDHRIPF
jgi:hypothetical protein